MRAIVLEEAGPPERLLLRDVPEPLAGPGQRLMRVRACGINFMDVLVRTGTYPQAPPLPTVLGVEVAGDVDGARTIGLTRSGGGGYAEWALVDEQWLFPLPESATYAEGAAFAMAFLTAWIPLTRQVTIRPGSTVLVHAAAGGVGSAAVQVAKLLGARVIATAGSEEKLALPLSLGAETALTYDRLREVEGVDVVIDPVGGQVFADSLRTLAPLGVVVAIGYAGGLWQELNPALLVGRNVGVQGFYLGRLMGLRPQLVQEAMRDLLRLWEQGALRPVVGAEFPLEQASEAHRLIESRQSTGKVVLTA